MSKIAHTLFSDKEVEICEGSNKDNYIMAIESSCDETACAVVKNGREVLANVVASQIDIHNIFSFYSFSFGLSSSYCTVRLF